MVRDLESISNTNRPKSTSITSRGNPLTLSSQITLPQIDRRNDSVTLPNSTVNTPFKEPCSSSGNQIQLESLSAVTSRGNTVTDVGKQCYLQIADQKTDVEERSESIVSKKSKTTAFGKKNASNMRTLFRRYN